MSFLFCCSSCNDSAQTCEERQPLIAAESTRQSRPPAQDMTMQNGRLFAKLTGVPELDGHFADIAETFNQQHEHYVAMTAALRVLRESYGCSNRNGLSECLHKMQEKQNAVQLRLQMKGYDFALVVSDAVPAELQQAQEQIGALCRAVKAIMAAGPRLQGMVSWVLQEEQHLAQRVKEGSPGYQDQLRVEANLRENLQAAVRQKQPHKSLPNILSSMLEWQAVFIVWKGTVLSVIFLCKCCKEPFLPLMTADWD
ncbi:hypothetical protein AGOR_G00045740 [Albula goreensis]|uniref:Uncharacterized protein n=1 Tax=Albula goreensis TaxID=1534307 RepID=A0A8T3E3I4_9TELE|nr:hypothetical protein AGOR_G00045740 [Albula goreensis]